MAKDPAVLWYWNDWAGGTKTFSRFLKGCYMDVLDAQFNNGDLSLEEIKTVLGSDFGQAWPTLQKKFIRNANGLYHNERLLLEKTKRENYTKSRSNNRSKKTYEKHMNGYMENENRNENENEIGKEGGLGEGFFVNEISKDMQLTNLDFSNVREFIKAANKKTLTDDQINEYWQGFKADNFGKKEWYADREKLISHFRHSLKKRLDGAHNTSANRNGKDRQANALATAIKTGKAEFAAAREKDS